jgi:tetratricopeptide (TPR) repeat protein
MELADGSPRLLDRAEVYFQAGHLSFRTDDYPQAEAYLTKALELYDCLEPQDGQARALVTLSQVWRLQTGATAKVLEYLQQALEIFRALGDQAGERDCLLSLANEYMLHGAFDKVLGICDPLLPSLRASNARDDIARCQYIRGTALFRRGLLEEGASVLEEAVAICRESGRTAAAQFTEITLGQALQALDRHDEARRVLEDACTAEGRLVRMRALSALADLCLKRGDLRRAFQHDAEALLTARELGSHAYVGRAILVMGQIRAADTRGVLPVPDAANPSVEDCFREGIERFEATGYRADLGLAHARYGEWLLAQGRAVEAKNLLQRAHELFHGCGMRLDLEATQAIMERLRYTHLPIPGHRRVRLARLSAPRGRPLRPDEMVEVLWTLEADEDQQALQRGGKVAQRQLRLRRLCLEAGAQGAEPTVDDLADALGVAARTVNRDLAAMRANGETLITRGASA